MLLKPAVTVWISRSSSLTTALYGTAYIVKGDLTFPASTKKKAEIVPNTPQNKRKCVSKAASIIRNITKHEYSDRRAHNNNDNIYINKCTTRMKEP